MKKTAGFITRAAIIAAVYAALTILLAPLSFGAVQCRISEALTVLPMLTPAAVPGLFVGCMAANFFTTAEPVEVIFGSLATLVSAILTYKTRRNKWLAVSFPVVVNAVVVGGYLGIYFTTEFPVWLTMVLVGLGQLLACYGLGMPLYHILEKRNIKL